MRVGVMALQGAVIEHLQTLKACRVEAMEVRTPEHLAQVDGLILPGGESTTIGKLLARFGLLKAIKERAEQGMPLWGTCAGMILLAKQITNGLPDQHSLALMDLEVERNAFGRQVDSFEAGVEVAGLGGKPFPAVFIRAPLAHNPGSGVEVLGRVGERIVAARQGNLLATSFHPELSGDLRFHRYFIEMIKNANVPA
ncbi:MAG: pyridoxal 5'-phosphate synthase glutaminase subunit PdxT [Vulcanimicrobiota bacterium]